VTATNNKPIFRLRMQPVDADRNDDIRHLRQVLKLLLRRLRFRVISVEQESQEPML
jgi:hypothetical protein